MWKKRWWPKMKKSWKGNTFLKKWFGTREDSLLLRDIRVTRRRIHLIHWRLKRGVRITIVQEESPTKRGYHCKNAGAYSSFLLGVYLCPSTHDRGIDNDWVLGKFDSVDRAAITILHELVHALGHIHQRFTYAGKLREVAGGQDNETRWWAAKLAERRPRRARRNPANVATLMHDMFWREISPTRKPDGIS